MREHLLKTKITDVTLAISDEPGPNFLTTFQIQKGLIMCYHNKELAQEGLGFGVPIVRTPTETIFSRHARIKIDENRIVKNYDLDCVSRITFGGKPVQNKAFRSGFESLVKWYMGFESFQPLMLKIQQKMAKSFDAACTFIDIPSMGRVEVEYLITNDSIDIKSEFEVSLSGAKCIMANEQGADFFDYAVIDGRYLLDHQIKGWIKVQNALFKSKQLGLWFSIKSPPESKMFLGRERNDYLCWSGINIERNSPCFNYRINVGGHGHG